ncbi:MAG: hypothetical protein ACKVRO_00815 [Micropepsaceae bacterium]
MSRELDTLDQISEGGLPLQVVRRLYPDEKPFAVAIHALLRNGDVQLLSDGVEVPRWRWRELFEEEDEVTKELPRLRLQITDKGARTLYGEA